MNTFMPHKMERVVSSNPKNTRDKPSTVVKYNKTMGGVDEVDKIIKPYQCRRKTIRWYRKLFFHLNDLAVYNSFLLYKWHTKVKISYFEFLLKLIEEIFNTHIVSRKRKGRPVSISSSKSTRLEGFHFPEKVCKANGHVTQKSCYFCRLGKKRKMTSFECKKCGVRLCIGTKDDNCSEKYHTNSRLPQGRSTPTKNLVNNSMNSIQIVPESENIFSEETDYTLFDESMEFQITVSSPP